LRRKAQKFIQSLHERGRQVAKGVLGPDLMQIAIARKRNNLVEVAFKERPRKLLKGVASDPQVAVAHKWPPLPEDQKQPLSATSEAKCGHFFCATAPARGGQFYAGTATASRQHLCESAPT
jgi:hypothetical protein